MTQRETDLLERIETDTGAPDVAHIVTPKDAVVRAYITGAEVEALCGVRFVPSRDPEDLPVCQACAAEKGRRVSGIRGLN